MKRMLPILLIAVLVAGRAPAEVPEPESVPKGLSKPVATALTARRQALDARYTELVRKNEAFVKKYGEVVVGSREEKEGEAQKAKLQAATDAYATDVEQYNADVEAAVTAELASLDDRIKKRPDEIRKLAADLQGYQAAVEEWSRFGEEDRAKAQAAIKYALLTALLGKMSEIKLGEAALADGDAKRIQAVFGRTYRGQYLRDVQAQAKGLKTEADVLHLLEILKTGVSAGPASELKDYEEVCTVALKVVEILNKDPKFALLIADGEIWIDTAYAWAAKLAARERFNQFFAVEDQQLKAIGSVSALYKKEIDARNGLRKSRKDGSR